MRKGLLVILVVGLVLIGLTGCVEEEEKVEGEKKQKPKEEYKIEDYSVIVENGIPYLKVKLKGKAPISYLKVMLSDPEGATVDKKYVSKEDLFDGVETIKLRMTGFSFGQSPKAGAYTISVVDVLDKQLCTKTVRFNGGQIEIKEVEFEVKSYEGFFSEKFITGVSIVVVNKGDLPVVVNKAVIEVDGQEKEIPLLQEWIPPNKSKKIIEPIYISDLGGGTHSARVTLYSDDVEVATYELEFDI